MAGPLQAQAGRAHARARGVLRVEPKSKRSCARDRRVSALSFDGETARDRAERVVGETTRDGAEIVVAA